MTKKNSPFLANNLTPILILAVIALSFGLGTLWQKVQALEGGIAKTANVAGSNENTKNNPVTPQAPTEAGDVDPVAQDDHVMGNRNARIALIEYSDLECPFCQKFHPTAEQVVDEYPNDVMWVYRHFPLTQIHSKAPKEAEATECAAKLAGNDGFWALTDKIFEVSPTNNGLDLDILPDLATQIGLNRSAFQTCLDSGEMAIKVDEDYQSGLKAGVSGTPGNILLDTKTGETQLIPGAVPFAQLQQAIDAMLAS